MMQGFSWNVRVYYEDTDAGGVVFYANYLKFFERARTEWLRAAGIGQQVLAERDGVIFVIKSTALEYMAPAKLDDELELTTTIEKMGRTSVSFVQEAWRRDGQDAKLLARGSITVVCVKIDSFRPTGVPPHILNSLNSSSVQLPSHVTGIAC